MRIAPYLIAGNCMKSSKIIFLLILFLICFYSSHSFPEDKDFTATYDNGLFTINAKNVPIADIVYHIYRETKIDFVYSKNSLQNKVTFETTKTPIRKTIKELFKVCKIKNYSINLNKDKTIKSVEIFSNLDSATSSSSSSIDPIEPDIDYEYIDDFYETEDDPIITHREYDISDDDTSKREYKPPSKIPEDNDIDEEDEDTETFSSKRTTTTKNKYSAGDQSREYRPPGSSSRKRERTVIKDEIEDMSDSYHPPGYVPKQNTSTNRSTTTGEIEDMSDRYYPPGSKN